MKKLSTEQAVSKLVN